MNGSTVAFVGLGYIGLPTAVVLANSGVKVTGVDVNESSVRRINAGETTIVEPGLEDELRLALEAGNLRATTVMPHEDIYIIAVPTPFTEGYEVDMQFIFSAASSIAPLLRGGEVVILESTSPPGTTRKLAERIVELRPDLVADGDTNEDAKPVVYFAYCPERILPGRALDELRSNDRIIGGMTEESTRRATQIYSTFCRGELLATDDVTAEMAKLTENAFRDVNIAFANELSVISEKLGVDVWELIDLANHHPRVNILQPGPGVGGHCIAVDPWFIVSSDPENSRLIKTARTVNDDKPRWVIDKVERAVSDKKASSIAILGLAFKANIDDLRESPSLDIAARIASAHPQVSVKAVEPNIQKLPPRLEALSNISLSRYEEAVDSSEVVVLLVDHDEFKDLPTADLGGKKIIDTTGMWR